MGTQVREVIAAENLTGAVAGGTSGHLANLAGYNVNIGLAVASGAAAGGITGGLAHFDIGGALAGAAGGAVGAAISGSDPGMGAAIAASSAAFAMGVMTVYEIAKNWGTFPEAMTGLATTALVDGRIEVGGISSRPTTTTTDMARGIIRASMSIDRGGQGLVAVLVFSIRWNR